MGIATNTEALYNFPAGTPLVDSSGNNHTLINVGSVPFVSTPPPPDGSALWAGTYLVGRYLKLPTSFETAFNGLTTWTVECKLRFNSIANGPNIFTFHQNSSNFVVVQSTTAGAIRVATVAGFSDSADGLIVINTDYFFAFSFDGTTLRGYISPAATPDSVVDVSRVDAAGVIPASATETRIGQWALTPFENPMDGYIDQARYSDVQRTVFPTTDTEDVGGHGRRGRR